MTFKTNITELLGKDLDAVKAHFESHQDKLGNIKFLDLLLEHYGKGEVKGMNHGVYMFFNPQGQCAYIGKSNNQNFAERLGANFGMMRGYRGNVYLHRTLMQSRMENNPNEKPEPKDYAAMVNKMYDHSISLINVYGWEGKEDKEGKEYKKGIKDVLRDHGGDPNLFEGIKRRGKERWGKEVFVSELETTLQAIYCPPKSSTHKKGDEENDHFLIMPKRGRNKLRKRQKKIFAEAGKPFAKIIGIK